VEYAFVGMGRLATRPSPYSIKHSLRLYQKIPKPSSRNSFSSTRPARPNPIASSYFFGEGLNSPFNQYQNRILTRNKHNQKCYQVIQTAGVENIDLGSRGPYFNAKWFKFLEVDT
jgi:hypothetical protein